MRFKQVSPVHLVRHPRGKLRLYSPSQMMNAFKATMDRQVSIREAAELYGVPFQTLRDRVAGVVDPECVVMGKSPELNLESEARLVAHLKDMASIGYGYTRQEVVDLASHYAVHLKVRDRDHPFSLRWFYSFMKRWPDLSLLKPRSLEFARAKGSSKANVDRYFEELTRIISKYNLQDKPHFIFNIDEKGVSPEHRPPNVVGSAHFNPPAVTSGRADTVTVIGCGSASGTPVPPYFVFPGKKMQQRWMDGSTPGADGTVSDSGWSNSQIFINYLKHHFLSFVPGTDEKILILLDGHKSHVSIPVIDWALDHGIIIQILPAHTSHILQPLDVGIFGPFQKIYDYLCHKQTRSSSTIVTKDDVCQIACTAYLKSCTPENLLSALKKTGIFPLSREIIDEKHLTPSEVLISDTDCDVDNDCHVVDDVECDVGVVECDVLVGGENVECESETEVNFFNDRMAAVKAVKKERVTKKRNTLSKVVSGRAITESDVAEKVRAHVSKQKGKAVDSCSKGKGKCKGKKGKTDKGSEKGSEKPIDGGKRKSTSKRNVESPKPGPSHIYVDDSYDCDMDSEDAVVIDESELCCVCGKFTPDAVRKSVSLIIVKWVQCDACKHWTHLCFCTNVRVVRTGSEFLCMHCDGS